MMMMKNAMKLKLKNMRKETWGSGAAKLHLIFRTLKTGATYSGQ